MTDELKLYIDELNKQYKLVLLVNTPIAQLHVAYTHSRFHY